MPKTKPKDYYAKMDDLVEMANDIRNGARLEDYGDVKESHDRIAQGWSVLLGVTVETADVARCMTWLKLVRSTSSPEKEDSYADMANYAVIAGALAILED